MMGPARKPPADPADSFPVLLAFVILLVGLPTQLVIGPLGAAGSPASLLAVAMFLWWCMTRMVPHLRLTGAAVPLRATLMIFSFTAVLSYLAAMTRGISGSEVSSAERGLLTLVGWLGVTLVAAEGLASRRNIDRLLRAIVVAGTILALLGALQFFTGLNPAGSISIPGLQFNQAFGETVRRSGFNRVQATTGHPIEFGVVLSLILPLALHYAWHAPAGQRRRWWAAVVIMAMALPMTVARSAILGASVAIFIVFLSWRPAQRKRVLLVAPFLLIAMKFMIPGLLGTLKSLFLNVESDPSTQGRTQDYTAIASYVSHDPVIGRGISTFIPSIYRTLDNAYLGWIVETGVVGMLALLALMMTGVACALRVRYLATDTRTKDLAVCLTASLASAVLSFGTFDALGFAMCAGIYFLLLGVVGALLRLYQAPLARSAAPASPWWLALRIGTVAAVAAIVAGMTLAPRPEYWAEATLAVRSEPAENINPFAQQRYLDTQAEIAVRVLDSRQLRAELSPMVPGGSYTVAIGDGSLAPLAEHQGHGTVVKVRAVAGNADDALAMREVVTDEFQQGIRDMQTAAGAPPQTQFRADLVLAPDSAAYVGGRLPRALVAACLLVTLALISVVRPKRLRTRIVSIASR